MPVSTARQRQFFADQGYLPFGRIYAEQDVERLRKAVAEVRTAAIDAGAAVAPVERSNVAVSSNLLNEPGKTTLSVRNLFRVNDVLRRHAFHAAIAEVATELLATDEVRLLMDQLIVKEPEISGTVGWHQDFAFWALHPPVQVSCWLALDHVTKPSGAMQFVPGSHRLGEFARVLSESGRKSRADSRPVIPRDPAAEGYETVAVELAPGECIFHHCLTWHATEPNNTACSRRALVTRFMARGTVLNVEPAAWDEDFPVVWPQP